MRAYRPRGQEMMKGKRDDSICIHLRINLYVLEYEQEEREKIQAR